ncbi:MAG: NusG domain II-containing protein [Eubacteriales bacterium]|nr:NusG domain II-containing protein [Eubacteriales bacterium]
MKKKKKDLILALVILVIAAAGFLVNNIIRHSGSKGPVVEVSAEGTVISSTPLSEDLDLVIQGAGGGTNHLIVKDGMAWIGEATCPDKVCIHQGKISLPGELLVCLPNQVIVMIKEPKE